MYAKIENDEIIKLLLRLSEKATAVYHALSAHDKKITQKEMEDVRDSEIKARYFITRKSISISYYIVVITLFNGGLIQKEIAEKLNISKGYVSKLVKKAKLKGHIKQV